MANLQRFPPTFLLQLQSSPNRPINPSKILCSEHAPEIVIAHREDIIAKDYSDLVTQPISAYQVITRFRRSAPKVLQHALVPLSEGGPIFVCRVREGILAL